MKEIAQYLKFMKFFAHFSHHFVLGSVYFADHSFLNDLYVTYDQLYDDIIERMIGLGMDCNEFEIVSAATEMFNEYKNIEFTQNIQYFSYILGFERKLRDLAESAQNGASSGVINLLQGIQDESESRSYKIGQRVKVK